MQKQGGGGNNPTCGCDMQAGWPSASELPRGGIQGGGDWNFNTFNLALTKNGSTRHLRGRWNKNKNKTKTNNNSNNNNSNNNNSNNNSSNNNRSNNNMMTNRATYRPTTSAPPHLKKVVLSGNIYKTDPKTGKTFNQNGDYEGILVRPTSGKPYLDTSLSEEMNSEEALPPSSPKRKTLKTKQDGGKRKTRRHHKKRCKCFLCMFKKLKV